MKILGLSFDADGCLYHKSYFFAVMLTQLSSLSSKKQRILYKKILLEENRDFLQWIKKYVNQYDLAFTYVGSYRQSYSIDLAGSAPRKHPRYDETEELSKNIIKRYQLPEERLQIISDESFMATTDFFFNSIQTIADEIGAQLHPLLMADIFGNLDDGESFSRAQREQNEEEEDDHASSDQTDYAKISILYTQTHHLACKYPEDDITFMFFDDRYDILDALDLFFSSNPEWLPTNVVLQLKRYTGSLPIERIAEIKGKGTIDTAYRDTAQLMDLIADCFQHEDRPDATMINAGEHITHSKIETLRLLRSRQTRRHQQNMSMSLIRPHLLRHAIVQENNLNEVQFLIKGKRSLLDQLDENGAAPLHLAAIYNRTEIVDYLIAEGTRSLGIAIKQTDLTSQKKRRYPNMTALDLALIHRHGAMAMKLSEAGDTHTASSESYDIHKMVRDCFLIGVKILVEHDQTFIDAKDHSSQTPLLWAASRGHVEIVTFLIQQGADVNAATLNQTSEHNNYSVLDWAIVGGYTVIISLLIEAGAKANHSHLPSPALSSRHGALGLFNPAKKCIESTVDQIRVASKRDYQSFLTG